MMRHMNSKVMRLAAALLLCLAMMAGLTTAALAKGSPSVTYIDENGAEHKVTGYNELRDDKQSNIVLQSGTYVTKMSTSLTLHPSISIQGDVLIIIKDTIYISGIWIGQGASLTIYGIKGSTNEIFVTHEENSCITGICGPGKLTLCSGKVVVSTENMNHPAFGADGGTYIRGGTLHAEASELSNSPAVGGSGPVLISGGEVEAYVLGNNNHSAAIGSSEKDNGTVTITGGSVSAHAWKGAGIGGGSGRTGTVTITGGTVEAVSTEGGAGIGNGEKGNGGSISISGGSITAKGFTGIGSGAHSSCGKITITGGTVNAEGSSCGIGCDRESHYSALDNIEITGGNVTASSLSKITRRSGISTAFAPGKKLILGWTNPSDRISGNFVSSDYQAQNVELRNYFWLGNESTVATGANLDQRTLIPSQTANIFRARFYSHNNDIPWQETLIVSGGTPADPGNPYADEPDKQFLGWRAGSYDGPAATFGAMTEELDLYAAYRSAVTLRYNNGKFDETVYVNAGDTLPRPEDPYDTAEGVHFSYWYNAEAGHTPYDFSTPVYDGFTLTAQWWYPGIDFEGGYTAEYTDFASIIGHGNNLQGDVVVMNTFQISGRLRVSGKVRLILCDGITLYASGGIEVPEGSTLEIYGQSEGTGTLRVDSAADHQAGIGSDSGKHSGAVHIYGGTLEIHGGYRSAGIGGGFKGNGNVTIHGGHVEAYGGELAPGLGGGCLGEGP